MKNNPTSKQYSQTDWHLLGQSKLSIGSTSQTLPQSWLFRILEPLNLPTDLTNKLKLSFDETISQFSAYSRIKVRLYISKDMKANHSSNKNWGYFKLEKVDTNTETKKNAEHIIEYYLYVGL